MDLSKYKNWADFVSQFGSQNAKYGSQGGEPSWNVSGVGDFSPYYGTKNREASPWEMGETPQGYLMGAPGQNGTGNYQYLTQGANGGIDSKGYHHDHTSWQNDLGTIAATIAAPFAAEALVGAEVGAGGVGAGEAAGSGGVGLTEGSTAGSLASNGLGGAEAAGGGFGGAEASAGVGVGITGNGVPSLASQGLAGGGMGGGQIAGAAGGASGIGASGQGGAAAGSGGAGGASSGGSSLMDNPFVKQGVGALVKGGIGAALSGRGGGMFGGGGGNGGPGYVPYNQQGIDQSFNNNFNAYQNQVNSNFGQMQPNIQSNFNNQFNNPAAAGYLQNSQNAGRMYGNAGQGAMGAGQDLYGAGKQAYNTGFDPMKSVYNQNVSDLTDNVRAGEYARGIGMSPAGASVEANALGRFQNDWQTQSQGRQLAGLQGMGRAYGEASGLQGQGAQFSGMAGSVPYDAQNNVFGQQRDAVNNFYGAQQPNMQGWNQLQSNSLGYMNNAQGAQNQSFYQGLQNRQQQNQNFQQLAPLINGFGGQLKNWWDGWGSGSGSGGDYGSTFDPYQSSMSGGFDPQGL